MRIQLLEPNNACINPIKCYYPKVKHRDCGDNFIVVERAKISMTEKNTFFKKLRGKKA